MPSRTRAIATGPTSSGRKPIDLADIEDTDDVRVGELRERARFLHEELAEGVVGRGVGVENLDRYLAAERGVLREVDL